MKTLKGLSLIIISLVVGFSAFAEKMDSETQNAVIDRLERVLSQMEKNDGSWAPAQLRLADLLSERARLRFMNEIEANCKGCKGSEKDRKQAIEIYETYMNKAGLDQQGAILFQLAHLYDMHGQSAKSMELFNRVIESTKPRFSKELVAAAHEGLADDYFRNNKYAEAETHYKEALKSPDTGHKALLQYRISWCEFNQDHLKKAIKTLEDLLDQPQLLTKETADGNVYDSSLHEDISHDLATFYCRDQVTQEQIEHFSRVIPKDARKDLLLFFASETDRLGQKKASSKIYALYMQENLTKEERMDALVSTAQAQYDGNLSYQSVEDFALAAKAFKDTGCKTEAKCVEFQKRMKHYVTELHRSHKTHLTPEILKTYKVYTDTFPDDAEMATLGAQVAMDLKDYNSAIDLYYQAALASRHQMKDASFKNLPAKEQNKSIEMLSNSLLGGIEAAEISKNLDAREKAYINYLALLPNGDKQYEAYYQLAQVAYERKQWAQAAKDFKAIALEPKVSKDLRKKSADLALDCLAIEKRDAEIESWSQEFAQALPSSGDEYRKISRKAVINEVASTANDQHSSNGDLKSALNKLRSANLKGASDVEKILHYKNEAVLAQKVGDNAALIAALDSMLAIKSLSATDREETLARKVGFYESRLEFKPAYQTAMLMKFPHHSVADKELRLGTLAELAGISPVAHYRNYLQANGKGSQATFVRTRLIALSPSPLAELKKQKSALASHPATLGEVVLSIYGKYHDLKMIQPFLNMPGVASSPSGKLILKQPYYREQANLDHQIAQHKLNGRTDSLMGKTIKERMTLLAKADASLKKALALKDFTAEVMALNTVSRENYRMANDLVSLPAPPKLNAAQKNQYMMLIKQKAMPYVTKAQVADSKLQEFWANTKTLNDLLNQYATARKEVKPLLHTEMAILATLAPSNMKGELTSALKVQEPSMKDLITARRAVSENPDNAQQLQNLKVLETKIGNPVMATYLDNRLSRSSGQEVL